MEEDRAIRLFVSGKITEAQLDHQRRFITERLESARARLDDYRAREGWRSREAAADGGCARMGQRGWQRPRRVDR